MPVYPIVGVLGQLNAGKSSVVASFLSARPTNHLVAQTAGYAREVWANEDLSPTEAA